MIITQKPQLIDLKMTFAEGKKQKRIGNYSSAFMVSKKKILWMQLKNWAPWTVCACVMLFIESSAEYPPALQAG